jgi:hypothetical protein
MRAERDGVVSRFRPMNVSEPQSPNRDATSPMCVAHAHATMVFQDSLRCGTRTHGGGRVASKLEAVGGEAENASLRKRHKDARRRTHRSESDTRTQGGERAVRQDTAGKHDPGEPTVQ